MEYLVLGPGAMGFFSILGHLKTIEPKLRDIKEISGASAGSILAVLLSLGKSIDEIADTSLRLNISDLVKLDLKCFIRRFGLIDTSKLRKKLVEVCGCDPTFSELEKKIYVSAFCLNTCKTEYFSVDIHPDMKVLDAVCMSISIPFVFSSYKLNDMTYIDGGTNESLPMGPFLHRPMSKVYCIEIQNINTRFVENIDNPKTFAERVVLSSLNNRYNYPITEQTIKRIDVGDMNIFDFNMSYENKVKMYMLGMV